jgi:hypothetical protein
MKESSEALVSERAALESLQLQLANEKELKTELRHEKDSIGAECKSFQSALQRSEMENLDFRHEISTAQAEVFFFFDKSRELILCKGAILGIKATRLTR